MKKLYITISLICTVLSLQAQKQLSLEEARLSALEYNRSLKVSESHKQAAEAQKKDAFTNYLPSLAASSSASVIPGSISTGDIFLPTAASPADAMAGSYNGVAHMPNSEIDNFTFIMADVSVQQAIYAGGKIRTANKMAESGIVIAEQAYQLKESEVILNTDEAYWQLAALREGVILAEKYVQMLDTLEGQLNASYELGLVPKSEQLKVKVQKNDAELSLLRASNGYKMLQMNLCQVIGLPLDTEFELTERVDFNPTLPNLVNGNVLAQDQRQELKILQEQGNIAGYEKRMVNAEYLPQLGAQAGYNYFKIDNLIDDAQFMVAASLHVPIFNWNQRKHKRVVAQTKIDEVNYNLEDTKEFIQLEVQQIQLKLQEGFEEVLWAQRNKSEAQESLEETQLSFDVGLNTTTDLLNAQATWQNAQAKEVQSLANFEILKTQYLKVIGSL
ncbi:TolC family protein [Saccharicrinis aurantiacus]|uniref:TolC family protein n=1 Tax=Saccharicrinis aurantiacus TaxID=1849719 RepID=UPI00249042A6|nr:TolC family protein [Saccharicrinis aurantiacus]